ncbi:ATP-dependent RNA helicase DDX51 [Cynoglossus semilaevis]|uniref:ATP-dependent RNA helicase n=1 Tax=Cynoglossus semilaevis TaxID=244447 RepID=A0A3P8WK03_CYNSE|nr:ATP-dependent RNA helicase DDX51 [Cynoglossus semilaevis]
MSLFLVNRYLGEEEDENISKEHASNDLLAKLQKKSKQNQEHSLKNKTANHTVKETQRHDVVKKRKSLPESNQEAQPRRKKKLAAASSRDLESNSGSAKGPSDACLTPRDGQKDEKEEEATAAPEAESEKPQTPGFTVMASFENKPVQKVHRVLPQWLAQPDVFQREIKNNLVPVSDIRGLCAPIVQKLHNNGIDHFFPVQAEVIPAILENMQNGLLIGRGGYKPRDLCVSAPTGSGKTLAFVLPIIQLLMERVVCEVRALAVLPTKELAQQVFKVFTSYAEGTPLKVVMVAGQKSFAAEQASLSEMRGNKRRSLADIVVSTPGRLVDHINKNSGFSLENLVFLVIDEADKMIDRMHQSWLRQVVKAVYKTKSDTRNISTFARTEDVFVTAASLSPPQIPLQKLLFSATLTQNPEKLQQLGLHQPRLFTSTRNHSAHVCNQDSFDFPQGLTEFYVPCTLSKKPLILLHFILRLKLSPILCFTNSRETAHRLFLLVQLFGGVQAAEFSSRLSPAERKHKLKEFEQGKIQLLISTDASARGIDINQVKCVVNYDAPQYIRTYIHRIGRTARAGKAGLAFTFLLGVQEKNFLQMVTNAGSPGIQKQIIKPENLKSMEARYEEILQELAKMIKSEKVY